MNICHYYYYRSHPKSLLHCRPGRRGCWNWRRAACWPTSNSPTTSTWETLSTSRKVRSGRQIPNHYSDNHYFVSMNLSPKSKDLSIPHLKGPRTSLKTITSTATISKSRTTTMMATKPGGTRARALIRQSRRVRPFGSTTHRWTTTRPPATRAKR